MWTGDYDKKQEDEEKSKQTQPFWLGGYNMIVKLPNGMKVEISSNSNRLVVVSKGMDKVTVSEEFGSMRVNSELFEGRT